MFQMLGLFLALLLLLGCEITTAKGFSLMSTTSTSSTLLLRSSPNEYTIQHRHSRSLNSINNAAATLLSTRGGAVLSTTTSTTSTSRFSKSDGNNDPDETDSNINDNKKNSSSNDKESIGSSISKYDESTSEDEEEEEEVVDLVVSSSFEETTAEAKTKEQARGSYFLSSVLWLSLAFDVILNKGKRFSLFGQEGLHLVNIISTFHLAIGFMLASALSYWLSSQEGNSHHTNKLPLVLCFFGLLNVGAHTHPTKSFLGQGAAIINIHNALVSINEYWKQKRLSLLLSTKYYNQSLKKQNIKQKRIWNAISKMAALLSLGSVTIPLFKSLPKILLPLEWASLARSTLLTGVALNYNSIRNSTTNWHFSAMVSIALLGLALPMWTVLFTASSVATSTTSILPSLLSTILFTLFATVSGWDAIQCSYLQTAYFTPNSFKLVAPASR